MNLLNTVILRIGEVQGFARYSTNYYFAPIQSFQLLKI